MKIFSRYIVALIIAIMAVGTIVPGVFNSSSQAYLDEVDPGDGGGGGGEPPSDPPPSDPTPPPPPPPPVPGTNAAPLIHIQFGDSGETGPNLPSECANQLGTEGTSTRDYQGQNGDADCLRVKIVDSTSTTYSNDFRFCLSIFGRYSCTGWASEIGLTQSNGPMTSTNTGNMNSTMYAVVETRSLSAGALPPGATFGNVTVGVALAYAKSDSGSPCRDSSGFAYAGQGNTYSNWAYGARDDDDPGCFSASMRIGVVNTPPDAEYVSTTIPSTSSLGATHSNKNIVMKNTGMPWQVANQSGSIVRDTDGHCDESNWSYGADGSNPCTDYRIYSSQRFRLERLDTTPVVVKSKELRPNSNDITYSNGNYSYSQPDTTISAQSSRGNVSTSNTIPFYIKQQITYSRVSGSYEECYPNPDPGDGGTKDGPGDQLPDEILNYINGDPDKQMSLKNILGIKKAQAQWGETCNTVYYDYIAATPDTWAIDVNPEDNATFAPVNITAPASNGTYTLRFRMVDLQNLNTNGGGWEGGQFGDEAQIVIQVGAPWSLNCSMSQIVNANETAYYSVYAVGTVPSSINVTLSSTPSGPTLAAPIVLNSSNGYTVNANVSTTGLAAGTYSLVFSGTDGVYPASTCPASLTINNPAPTVDLLFNGSAGPVLLTGNTTSGTLTWTSTNATSCTASTAPSAVTPPWDGAKATNDSQGVSGLAYGTSYTFSLTCTGPGGSYTDTVQVSSNASNPTGDLQCVTGSTSGQQSCNVAWGGSGALYWSTSYATSCTLTDDNSSLADVGSVPTNVSSGSPINTGNLYSTTTFTLTCQGVSGTTPSSDSLTITVNASPDYTFQLSAVQNTIEQNTSIPLSLLTSNPVDGFNSPVTTSVKSISPSSNAPTVSSPSNNPHTPPGVSNVTISTMGAAVGIYTIEFAANGGGVAEKVRQYVLTVEAATPPSPVVNLSASNATCGLITSTWQADPTHTTGMEYRVYKNTDGSNNWTYLTTIPYVSGQNNYSYTDGTPSSGSNYYSVVVYNGSTPSTRQITSPVAPQVCSVNIDFSNKDLIRVNSNTASAGADVENRCNGQSDVFTLPNQQIFKEGDKVYFRINVCNNGTQALTGITVNESAALTGLSNITYESSYTSPAGCVTNANDTTKIYTLADIAPAVNGNASICSFVLSGTVSSGGGPAGELYRFQNIATITAAQASKTIATPKYLYSVGSGVPTRNETAP